MKKCLSLILIFFLSSLIFINIPFVSANPDWLIGWSYRKSHIILNATDSGINYQIKIITHYDNGSDSGENVYLNNHSQTDFDDVRFTDNDQTTLLDYWKEEKFDSDNATFRVKITDNLSFSNVTIYIYYGNFEVSTTSNGVNTFLFFDDFIGSTINASKWNGDLDDTTVEEGICTLAGLRKFINATSGFGASHVFTTKARFESLYVDGIIMGIGGRNYTLGGYPMYPDDVLTYAYEASTGMAIIYTRVGKTWYYKDRTNSITNIYQIRELIYRSITNVTTLYNGIVDLQITSNIPDDKLSHWFLSRINGYVKIDWVYVRKYIFPEPLNEDWGDEEYGLRFFIFYHNIGGIFRVNDVTITNGSIFNYTLDDVLEFIAIPQNSTYTFQNFTWTLGNSTLNPYNFTVFLNSTIWCYFSIPEWDYTLPIALLTSFGLIVSMLVIAKKKWR